MAECMRGRFSAAGSGVEPSHGSSRIHSVGNVANTHVAKPVKEQEEDVMHDYIENPSEALIESIGPRCLSFEDQENCYVEPEETGRFGYFNPSRKCAPKLLLLNKFSGVREVFL
ncbi:unnamed protein product [Nippostrongylus brasiliensis]|uniref:Protein FAM13A n=1 Tax=Nippostrongylus brasiliensis TaxID=27835 RepID=A0A158R1P4_NIPBR|nr:unnamed protein product [Nippostrongylus brasiliensis]